MENTFKGRVMNSLEHLGSRYYLRSIINKIESPVQLINFIHRYTVFNGNFAGGVSNLAGAFHIRQDLFRDNTESILHCSDRSSEIASYIYFAAEDEYFDRDTGTRITHRRLAQELLKEIITFFNLNIEEFDKKFFLTPMIHEILEGVKKGYGLNKPNNEKEIFNALGFHIGSELLADQEFNILNEFLTENYPELVIYLKGKSMPYGKPAYHWIEQHTYVEVEHFDNAIISVEKVLKYYCGNRQKEEVINMILNGFLGFAKLQKSFFSNILN